ncbi:MAG: tetratricopeptide repeat protein, partial [Bacteroidota bacterium]|nr:tetratricopeptide repeat protein [Bacteroidota bacterium]
QVLIQLIRSGETESISKKIRDEIVPEMVKLAPRLTDKLDLDKLIPDDFTEEKNPDWEKIFKESEGLYEKIEEFSKLQMEGADVFMSAFSQLKQFSFFSEISNWFLPFIPDNPIIDDIFKFEDAEFDKQLFLSGLEKTGYMCNSDKYSFCLNVKLMPEAQKSMLLKMFQAELNSMDELDKENKIIESGKTSKTVYTQYIHDLYRFVKLYRFKDEFYDIFKTELDFHNTHLFKNLVKDDMLLGNIAEYYFQNEHFSRAIDIYLLLEDYNERPEIIEKIAYSYQIVGDFSSALKYYSQAEIFNSNKEWLLKKIGLCYRNLQMSEKALKYYQRAENIDPENLFTQASIGHCYLDLKDYEKALKYYFKVEYLDPKNKKVWRPLAWCCFVQGKFDHADKYYKLITEGSPNYHDYLNMGHLEWCKGNKVKATELYKKSIEQKGNNLEKFLEIFEQDKDHLLNHGISSEDLPILLDHIQYQLNK